MTKVLLCSKCLSMTTHDYHVDTFKALFPPAGTRAEYNQLVSELQSCAKRIDSLTSKVVALAGRKISKA